LAFPETRVISSQVDAQALESALTTRSITTGAGGANSNINVYLDVPQVT